MRPAVRLETGLNRARRLLRYGSPEQSDEGDVRDIHRLITVNCTFSSFPSRTRTDVPRLS
jgi:hypothetical protein